MYDYCNVLGETHPKEDKLLSALEKIKFLNGPSTVYNRSRFVYLKQCGLYVEEYNVSKVRISVNLGIWYFCIAHITVVPSSPHSSRFWKGILSWNAIFPSLS